MINPLVIFGGGRYIDNVNNLVKDNNINFSNMRNLQESVLPVNQALIDRTIMLAMLADEEYMTINTQLWLLQLDALRKVKIIPNCSGF